MRFRVTKKIVMVLMTLFFILPDGSVFANETVNITQGLPAYCLLIGMRL